MSNLTTGEIYAIERVIGGMSYDEKAVAVRNIPTEILQNEISRRLKRDNEKLTAVMDLVTSMEKY